MRYKNRRIPKASLLIKIRELVEEGELDEAAKLQRLLVKSIKDDKKRRLYHSSIDVNRNVKKVAESLK